MKIASLLFLAVALSQFCSCVGAPMSSIASYGAGDDIARQKDTRGSQYFSRAEHDNNRRQRSDIHGELSLEEHKRQQNNRNMLNPLETMARGKGYINQILR